MIKGCFTLRLVRIALLITIFVTKADCQSYQWIGFNYFSPGGAQILEYTTYLDDALSPLGPSQAGGMYFGHAESIAYGNAESLTVRDNPSFPLNGLQAVDPLVGLTIVFQQPLAPGLSLSVTVNSYADVYYAGSIVDSWSISAGASTPADTSSLYETFSFTRPSTSVI